MKNRFLHPLFLRFAGNGGAAAGPDGRLLFLFAAEGVLFALVNNLINNNNGLFALRLGASDLQLSYLSAFPQMVGLLLLIPGGILTDRLANKRRMVVGMLSLLAVAYLLISFVPYLGAYRFFAFLVLLSIAMGPFTIYNASWQAYFSDVVPVENRNRVLTKRTGGAFLVSIVLPLASGALLASAAGAEEKIRIHQAYFWTACLFLLLQIFVLTRIRGGGIGKQTMTRLSEYGSTVAGLVRNKRFLGFVGVALFFYMTWQMDWTLYFIGQVRYLKLNEAWLSYVSIGSALIQFLTVGFWSRVNEKKGIRFSIILGSVGLACCPIAMIAATSVPLSVGPALFLALNTLSNIAFATIPLNMLQCLLQVIPEKNKTLSISIYTVFITMSNAIMPMMGVKLYTALGADLQAFHLTFRIIFGLRIVSSSLWAFRWFRMRKEESRAVT